MTCEEILDSLAVGQKQQEDERVVLFLKMREGHALTPELVARLKALIRGQLSPRWVSSGFPAYSGAMPWTSLPWTCRSPSDPHPLPLSQPATDTSPPSSSPSPTSRTR